MLCELSCTTTLIKLQRYDFLCLQIADVGSEHETTFASLWRKSLGLNVLRLSPHLESKPFSAQPACDANYVTSRRCWRLQEGCLKHGGVIFADWRRDIC